MHLCSRSHFRLAIALIFLSTRWIAIAHEPPRSQAHSHGEGTHKRIAAIIRSDGGVSVESADEYTVVSSRHVDVKKHSSQHAAMQAASGADLGLREVDVDNHNLRQKIGIVVASYCNDDLRWLSVVNCNDVNIYLYNKCERQGNLSQSLPSDSAFWDDVKRGYPNKTASCVSLTTLPNQGRDSHSHLTHIHTHYHALEPFTVFLQGPLEFKAHVVPFLKWLTSDAGMSMVSFTGDLSARSGVEASTLGFIPLGSACCASYPFQGDAPWGNLHCGLIRLLSGSDTCNDHLTSLRGQFGISRERLQRNARALYQSMANIVVMKGAIDEEGFMPERSWALLAGCYGKHSLGRPEDIPACLDRCTGGVEQCGPSYAPKQIDTESIGRLNAEEFQKYLNSTGGAMHLGCTAVDNDPGACDLKQESTINPVWRRLRQIVGPSLPEV